jgi:hypothetical protein
MMNLFVSLFLFFSMTVWSEPPNKVKRVSLDKEFTIRVGEQVVIQEAGLKISFSAVKEDSRCPTGVNCIWAGNGKIIVHVSKTGRKAADIELNTGVEPKHQSYREYDIKLVGLNPYPKKDVKTNRGDYVATIVVSK